MNIIDLTGQTFGKLYVDTRAPSHKKPSGQTATMWNCTCECGNKTVVSTSELRSGGTLSCGCLRNGNFTRKYKPIATGDRFGYLTAIREIKKGTRAKWLFKCDCGKEIERRVDTVRHSQNASCGCMHSQIMKRSYKEGNRKPNVKDLTGKTFGRLLVIKRVFPKEKDLRHSWWQCQCSCGNITNIESGKLLRGVTQSCGCLAREKAATFV